MDLLLPGDESRTALWLLPSYPTGDNARTVFLRNRAQALGRVGYRVTVVAPTPRTDYPLVGTALRQRWQLPDDEPILEQDDSVLVHRPRYFAHPGQLRYGFPGSLVAAAVHRLAVGGFSVVHAHGTYPLGHAGLKVAQTAGVPFVLGLYGSDVNVFPHLNRLARHRFQSVVRRADAVIAVSDALAERAAELSGIMPRVVRTGIEVNRFAGAQPVPRSELAVPDDCRVVLYVGRLTREKGVDVLLSSIERLARPDVRFVFVGWGPLEGAVQETPQAVLLGPVPYSKVPGLMKAADLLVLPSLNEGLPNVVVEAGAAGIPVVASDAGGLKTLLGDGRGAVLSPVTASVVASTVRRVLEDAKWARQMSEKLHAHVVQLYDLDINSVTLMRLYRELGA